MASGPEFFSSIIAGREHLVVGGALGGIVRWMTLREKLWPDGVITIVTGMLCAPYVSPLAVPLLSSLLSGANLSEAQTSNLSAFVVGVGGMTVAGLIIDMWRARRESAVAKDVKDEPSD